MEMQRNKDRNIGNIYSLFEQFDCEKSQSAAQDGWVRLGFPTSA